MEKLLNSELGAVQFSWNTVQKKEEIQCGLNKLVPKKDINVKPLTFDIWKVVLSCYSAQMSKWIIYFAYVWCMQVPWIYIFSHSIVFEKLTRACMHAGRLFSKLHSKLYYLYLRALFTSVYYQVFSLNTLYLFDGNFFPYYNLFPGIFPASLHIDKEIRKPTKFEIV